jgi:hypothetical protein
VQAVINGEGQQASATAARPLSREVQQGDRITAAAQREGKRMIDVRLQPGVQPRLNPGGKPVGQEQPARVRTWPARVRRASVAVSA